MLYEVITAVGALGELVVAVPDDRGLAVAVLPLLQEPVRLVVGHADPDPAAIPLADAIACGVVLHESYNFV